MQRLKTRLQSDSNLKDLLRHTGIMYGSGMISTILIATQQITTANLVGAENYGRLAAVFASSALMILIMDVRTWELGTKLIARPMLDHEHTEITRVITWLLLADVVGGLLGAAIIFLLAQLIAIYLLHTPDLAWLVALYGLSIPFRTLSNGIARTTLRMYNRFDWLSVKSIIYGLSRLVLMTGAALLGLGLEGIIVGAILTEVIGAVVLLLMQAAIQKREMPDAPLFDFKKPYQFAQGMAMMKGLWLSATLAGLQVETFVPLLALLTSPAQVGLFRSGLDIAELVEKLTTPFTLVLFPQIMKSYEQNTRGQFLRLIKQASAIMASLTLPLVIAIFLIGPFILPRLLGSDYQGVAVVAGFIALGNAIFGILMWVRPSLIALGHIREMNLIGIAIIFLSTILLIVFAPHYGAVIGGAIRGVGWGLNSIVALFVFLYSLPRQKMPQERLSIQ